MQMSGWLWSDLTKSTQFQAPSKEASQLKYHEMSASINLLGYKRIGSSELRLIDFVLIAIGYVPATEIAAVMSRWHIFRYPSPDEWSALPMALVPVALISWSMASGYCNAYSSDRSERPPYITLNLLKTIGLWAIVTIGAVFLAKFKYNSRQFTLEFVFCAGSLIVLRELITLRALRLLRQSGYNRKTALVFGDKASCEHFIVQANLSNPQEYHFVPIVIPFNSVVDERAPEVAKSVQADEIFIIGGSLKLERQGNLAVKFLRQGKPVHLVPETIDASLFRRSLGEIGGMPIMSISCGRLTWVEKVAKRGVDLGCAALILVLSAPIWLLTAAIVKFTSTGPVLFRQLRLGREGQPFTLLKFRTMRTDAEEELRRSPELYQRYLNNNYKLPAGEDPRLTPVGAILRALSIDELPQLLNVIRGEMSLVGPRPIVLAEIEKYGEFAPLFLSAKPGLTGHWQVSGRSAIREYDQRMELDLEYIRDQSIRTDVGILLRTVPTILRRKGAY
jgi:exopolysaccharide production protein ExoY